MDQTSGVGIMQGVGDGGDQFRRIPEARSSLCDPDRQIVPLDEFGYDEAEPILRAPHVMDRHDVRVVQPGEDAGFGEERLQIPRISDALGVRHLDRHRTVQVVVASKIDPPEAALTQTFDDPVTPDPGGIAVRGLAGTHEEGLGAFGFRQALGLVHRPVLDHERSLMASGAIVAS
jgi:hypothetical protein